MSYILREAGTSHSYNIFTAQDLSRICKQLIRLPNLNKTIVVSMFVVGLCEHYRNGGTQNKNLELITIIPQQLWGSRGCNPKMLCQQNTCQPTQRTDTRRAFPIQGWSLFYSLDIIQIAFDLVIIRFGSLFLLNLLLHYPYSALLIWDTIFRGTS